MEPANAPGSPERAPMPVSSTEVAAPTNVKAVEAGGPAPQEVGRASIESANQNQGMTLPPVVNDPPVTVQQPVQQVATTQDDDVPHIDSPAIASDIDVIEKEWVNKAKTIIHQTRDDPHAQGREVSKLQADYLKKRYGKVIKPLKD